MSKYNFYDNGKDIVVCVSSYAGKKVRATAKCDPQDKFDYETGCLLAKGRVDAKIAEKRKNRAYVKMMIAQGEVDKALRALADMRDYYVNSCNEKEIADNALSNLLETL